MNYTVSFPKENSTKFFCEPTASFPKENSTKFASQICMRVCETNSTKFALRICTDLGTLSDFFSLSGLHRKEVIQPHLPIRLPCYDFTPVANPTFGSVLLTVGLLTSGITGSHGVTGGVYKARERIHRGMLIRDY